MIRVRLHGRGGQGMKTAAGSIGSGGPRGLDGAGLAGLTAPSAGALGGAMHGRARFTAVGEGPPAEPPERRVSLVLTTGRVLEHYHDRLDVDPRPMATLDHRTAAR